MVFFERTTDTALIHSILTHPKLYSRMVSDAAPERTAFQFETDPAFQFILASENETPAALFLLRDAGLFAHIDQCFLPHTWGRSEPIARDFIEWVWSHTHYRRLVGKTPAYNRLALRLAKRVGFQEFGLERDAVRKNGRVYDLVLLEAHNPEPSA